MTSLLALWAPILVSAVLVFIVSSVIHTLLKYHNADFKPVPEEDRVMAALAVFEVAPGDYIMPYTTTENMGSDELKAKYEQGPLAIMTVLANGVPNMGKQLMQWFAYCVLVSFLAGYVAAAALPAGSDYLTVFRVVGMAAFLGYAGAMAQQSIWFHKDWAATARNLFDGLIYGLVTAGAFGWLWPSS